MIEFLKRLFGIQGSNGHKPDDSEGVTSTPDVEQPTPTVSRHDVQRVVRRDFPTDAFSSVMAMLDKYGTSDWPPERDRIRLAAIKLSNGSVSQVSQILFENDWRDLLAYAEYPGYMEHFSKFDHLSQTEIQKTVDADWKQYNEWLYRD